MSIRPAVWNPQGCEDHQGTDITDVAAGVPLAFQTASDTLDKFVFCLDGRRRTVGSREEVHREPEDEVRA